MPTPPTVTRDYYTIGAQQPNVGSFNYFFTWAAVRTPVTAVVSHNSGGFVWGQLVIHGIDYVSGLYSIQAVESEGRLFRGVPFSVSGANDWSTFAPPSGTDQRFYFGTTNDDGSGSYIPTVGTGLDKEEEGLILEYASFVGSGQTIGVEPAAYDGSDPDGQNIGATPLGTVSSVTLSF